MQVFSKRDLLLISAKQVVGFGLESNQTLSLSQRRALANLSVACEQEEAFNSIKEAIRSNSLKWEIFHRLRGWIGVINGVTTLKSEEYQCSELVYEDQHLWIKRGLWVGVDLDGTLAMGPESIAPPYLIGSPIGKTMSAVRWLIAHGVEVKIMTARAREPEEALRVFEWMTSNGLKMEIVAHKDFEMLLQIDDRAMQVTYNQGDPIVSV